MYSVNFWGSHPKENNDDCWTGVDFQSLDEAQKFFDRPFIDPQFAQFYRRCTAVIELVGPNLNRTRHNHDFQPYVDDQDDWSREIAHQAGMMGGCEAYNEAMGWDCYRDRSPIRSYQGFAA